ncbi:hypothetical protein H6P81_021064 [Aristolochia fimbriata]|uniref:Uncharacterized protein n=1 Tax=Aristolochia fimbriata TaxID=158543 RepID=A0AAV7DWJ2_ARIFI|nr:hypothetical protein H6P81_021064 [Aristolochia fimbriata]
MALEPEACNSAISTILGEIQYSVDASRPRFYDLNWLKSIAVASIVPMPSSLEAWSVKDLERVGPPAVLRVTKLWKTSVEAEKASTGRYGAVAHRAHPDSGLHSPDAISSLPVFLESFTPLQLRS